MPDGYSQIFRLYVFGPSGFRTMAPLRYAAKFDTLPFLGLRRVGGRGGVIHLATLIGRDEIESLASS